MDTNIGVLRGQFDYAGAESLTTRHCGTRTGGVGVYRTLQTQRRTVGILEGACQIWRAAGPRMPRFAYTVCLLRAAQATGYVRVQTTLYAAVRVCTGLHIGVVTRGRIIVSAHQAHCLSRLGLVESPLTRHRIATQCIEPRNARAGGRYDQLHKTGHICRTRQAVGCGLSVLVGPLRTRVTDPVTWQWLVLARDACQTRGLVDEVVPRSAVARVSVVSKRVRVQDCGTARSRLPPDAEILRLAHDKLVAILGSFRLVVVSPVTHAVSDPGGPRQCLGVGWTYAHDLIKTV